MENILKADNGYKKWIESISQRYAQCQIKAAVSVNREMLLLYWSLGKDIAELKAKSQWGSGFYDTLSKDLKKVIPNVKGFSATNLKYMCRFYTLYKSEIRPQLVDELENQPVDGFTFDDLLSIPWGHHRYIIDHCSDDVDKAFFYLKKTIQNNWSRAVLLNFLDTNLYERQGKAITNFESRLPAEQSELAQEVTKDPYNFDFLTIREDYDEKELKDALMDNITRFLLELGTGFAFVGREYRLVVGNTEEYIDMLFYNIQLHCYVVIEVKVTAFKPADIGQLGTYVAAVNHILKSDSDAPSIGLLICKTKDNVLAQYATESSSEPIGISEYQLNSLLPEQFKGSLPTIEEIESELR